MRLHQLEITAFGPFADTVTVDFDHLSGAGLFLLSGATGAGKTSVLDAVCFALYGDVPGDRSTARRLRSDHAGPGVAPRVVLEATLAGRRFRITRSPQWERPKKRGTGTTTEQASVVIAELIGRQWVTLSTRLDETGHLMTRLVGMNVTQFTQVAMLPQGRFQAFLRARSEERHQLLQQLFRTGRFEDVERWLRDRRKALGAESALWHQSVADLVSRSSEATDVAVPDSWDILDLAPAADDGSLRWWSEGLRADAELARRDAEDRAATAARAEQAARADLDAARILDERRARFAAADVEHRTLLASADRHAAEVRRLDDARRAATVAPVRRIAGSARAAEVTARSRADEALVAAGRHFPELPEAPDDLAPRLPEALGRAAEEAAAARAAQPRAARLAHATRELEQVTTDRVVLDEQVAATRQHRDVLPARIDALRAGLTAARAAESRVDAVRTSLRETDTRITGHLQVRRLSAAVSAAGVALRVAQEQAVTLREQWLDVREARLESMAAEIAGALAVGASCPVCGSADHPHKATPAPGSADAAAERDALRAVDDAKATEHLRDVELRELTGRLSVVATATGDSPEDELRTARTALDQELAALTAHASRVEVLERDVAAAEGERDELAVRLHTQATRSGALTARAESLAAEHRSLTAEIDELLDGTGHHDLTALLASHAERERHGRRAVQACADLETAVATAEETDRALAAAVAGAGFATVDEAAAAFLEPASLETLDAEVSVHDRRLAAVSEVLGEPGAAELAESEPPDLTALETAHRAAATAHQTVRSQALLWTARVDRLTRLVAELDRALQDWAPVRAEWSLTTRLAAFVEGKSADNRLQMRLSAYVLAYRLSQVVAAANERLARMSDQRYSLEHTAQRGAGETRGGLSLAIRDDWSGECRDPVTLSGGETFVVSLALALGLADVITQEAGGADLDTLFVDEGFGSLDADTLDDVMDTLDALRDGGRVVGVVSHVAEMRDRIPTQLVVAKARNGSTLSITR